MVPDNGSSFITILAALGPYQRSVGLCTVVAILFPPGKRGHPVVFSVLVKKQKGSFSQSFFFFSLKSLVLVCKLKDTPCLPSLGKMRCVFDLGVQCWSQGRLAGKSGLLNAN